MEMVLTCVHAFLLAPLNWAAPDDALQAWQLLLLHIRLARRQPLVLELQTDRAICRIEICLTRSCVVQLRQGGRSYLNELRAMVHVFGRLPRPGHDSLFDEGGQVDMTQVDALVQVIHGDVFTSGGEESSEDEDM